MRGRLALFSLALLFGCQPVERTIKIGLLIPNMATGELATYAKYVQDGITLAAKSKNFRVKGMRIEFVYPDRYSGDPSSTSEALKELKDKGAKIIIGPITSSEAKAMLPALSQIKLPVILPAATLNSLTDNEWVWRVSISNRQMAVAAAYTAKDFLKLKEVGVVSFSDNPYSLELAEAFRNWSDAHALKISKFVEISGNSSNLSSALEDILKSFTSKPESTGIFLPLYYDEAAKGIRYLRDRGYKGVILGGDGWDVPKIIELVGSNVGENFFITHFNPYDPQSADFVEKYKAEYGSVPSSFSALGYDAFLIAYEAINRARGTMTITVSDIKDALKTLYVDGVTGRIEYSAQSRNPDTKGSVLVKFSDIGFQFVRRLAISPVF